MLDPRTRRARERQLPAGAPVLRLRSGVTRTWLLVPGSQKLIGRDRTNHIQLHGSSVSRFHARLTWSEGRPRPIVEDLCSVNGTRLDDVAVRDAGVELRDGAVLQVGDVRLEVDLIEDVPPALLGDATVRCRLFNEVGAPVKAEFGSADELRRALLDFEARRRTGTLSVVRDDVSQLTFARGRVVDARTPGKHGLAALLEILDEKDVGTYEFRLEFEPRECQLDVSLKDLLRPRSGLGAPTERVRAARPA